MPEVKVECAVFLSVSRDACFKLHLFWKLGTIQCLDLNVAVRDLHFLKKQKRERERESAQQIRSNQIMFVVVFSIPLNMKFESVHFIYIPFPTRLTHGT